MKGTPPKGILFSKQRPSEKSIQRLTSTFSQTFIRGESQKDQAHIRQRFQVGGALLPAWPGLVAASDLRMPKPSTLTRPETRPRPNR